MSHPLRLRGRRGTGRLTCVGEPGGSTGGSDWLLQVCVLQLSQQPLASLDTPRAALEPEVGRPWCG